MEERKFMDAGEAEQQKFSLTMVKICSAIPDETTSGWLANICAALVTRYAEDGEAAVIILEMAAEMIVEKLEAIAVHKSGIN